MTNPLRGCGKSYIIREVKPLAQVCTATKWLSFERRMSHALTAFCPLCLLASLPEIPSNLTFCDSGALWTFHPAPTCLWGRGSGAPAAAGPGPGPPAWAVTGWQLSSALLSLASLLLFLSSMLLKSSRREHTTQLFIYLFIYLIYYFLKKFIYSFIYFRLRWIFVAECGLSLVAVRGGYSSLWCAGFSLWWLVLLRSTGSRHAGFSSCGTWAQ